METHARSIVKALSYRVFGTIATAIIAWAITRKLSMGLAIGLVDTFVKLGVYYVHERAWSRLPYGRVIKPESEG